MTRYAAKIDANQPDIVDAFRKLGICVKHMHTAGHGVPDLLLAYGGYVRLAEIKTEKGRLTKAQKEWAADWTGGIYLIRNVDDVIACAKSMKLYAGYINEAIMRRLREPIRDDTGGYPTSAYDRGHAT